MLPGSTPATDSREQTRHPLAPALARVRAALQRQPCPAYLRDGSPLDQLVDVFGLSPFERDVLVLCAAMEIDERFAGWCAAAQKNGRRSYPTFALAISVLPEADWNAVLPEGPLRYWRLVELAGGESLTTSRLRVDECLLHFLNGVRTLDERLQGVLTPLEAAGALPPSQHVQAEAIARCWSNCPGPLPVAQICGPAQSCIPAIALAACNLLELRLLVLRAQSIPAMASEREELLRLCERHSVLVNGAVLVDFGDTDPNSFTATQTLFLERAQCPLLVATRDPATCLSRTVVRFDAALPTADEQRSMWQDALGAASRSEEIDEVVAHFSFSSAEIEVAAARAEADGSLWNLCRTQTRSRLEDVAQRIRPAATWADLVLPPEQTRLLRQIASQVRHRAGVYEKWGFARKSNRGLGISALFYGPSGSGKTMAAEVLANDLHLDLYRIDLSAVVSKYIGETEKNLRRVFDAAEAGGALLLFDEADALFGHRSEIRDSHDRYANIEVSYLLQRVECYRGLAILTSNMKQAIDTAFLRRLRFLVQFTFPEFAERVEIWRRVFPAETPTEGLVPEKLAKLSLAGGNIQNIAMGASFLAAEEGSPVRMRHVLAAARTECVKLERPLTEAEIGGWV